MGVVCYGYSRKMINHNILHSFFIFDLQVEFLEQEDPSNESSLGILLGKEVLQS